MHIVTNVHLHHSTVEQNKKHKNRMKRLTVEEKANKFIGPLNIIKTNFKNCSSFSKEELLKEFKKYGLPTSPYFWKFFKESGIIISIDTYKYTFVYSNSIYGDPIHVSKLIKVWRQFNEVINQNQKQYTSRKRTGLTSEQEEIAENYLKVEEAIRLLKDNGYIILEDDGNDSYTEI